MLNTKFLSAVLLALLFHAGFAVAGKSPVASSHRLLSRVIEGEVVAVPRADEVIIAGEYRGEKANYRVRIARVDAPEGTEWQEPARKIAEKYLLHRHVIALLSRNKEDGIPEAVVQFLGKKKERYSVARRLVLKGALFMDKEHPSRQMLFLQKQARKSRAGLWKSQMFRKGWDAQAQAKGN